MQELLDFDIVIESVSGGGYCSRVLASPVGETSANFELPFTDKDLTILTLQVLESISRARRGTRRFQSPERRLLEDFGGRLFNAVFSGSVRDCLGGTG